MAQAVSATWNLNTSTAPTIVGAISASTESTAEVGPGLSVAGTLDPNYGTWGQNTWPTTSAIAVPSTETHYIQFSITPTSLTACQSLTVTSINMNTYNNEGTPPDRLDIFWSTSATFASSAAIVTSVSMPAGLVNYTNGAIAAGCIAGQTIYIRVYFHYTASNPYFGVKSMVLSGSINTLNNNYACATALTVNAAATAGTTAGASLQANESVACNSTAAGQAYTVDQTVWYSFVASGATDYVQITQLTGCLTTFGATVWDPSIVAQNGSTYQTTNLNGAYCGMISCQGGADNNAASNPFLFQLCNLTTGNTYYVQVVNSLASCGLAATFNIAVTSANPGGTITNPCQPAGEPANYIAAGLSSSGSGPIAECYINACVTAPGCPSCTSYTLNGATGLNQDNIVWNSYYSFTTAGGCSNDLEFQECVSAQTAAPCNHGNVSWLAFQLYTTTGNCITSGDFSTNTDAYGYLGIPGTGCATSYVLQYTTEQLNCQYYYYTPFTDNYGSSSCVLPIVLTRFSANEDEQGAVGLNWTTATEVNNNYFTLARSMDGQNFTDIGKVKATGNSNSMVNYEFIDTTAAEQGSKVLYYKLSQTDLNGSSNSFNIVDVNLSKNFSLSVYPNPSNGDFNLDFNSNMGQFVRVDLVDITGTTISSKLYMGSGGLQHQKVQVPQAGMYILNITINGQLVHKKVVKQ